MKQNCWRVTQSHPANQSMAKRYGLDVRTDPITNKPINPRDYAKARRLNKLMRGYERA